MGDPKKRKKTYDVPKKNWDLNLLKREKTVVETYGLKNKRELWKFETVLKNKRKNARNLLALNLDERIKREKDLIESLKKIGLLGDRATLEDVLGLTTEALLERRLQTLVLKKGLALSTEQARQFIVHGHIAINGRKVSKPSYIVTKDEEFKIAYHGNPLKLEIKKPKSRELKKQFEEALPAEAKELPAENQAIKEKEDIAETIELESAEIMETENEKEGEAA